jgi:hypothetical protein
MLIAATARVDSRDRLATERKTPAAVCPSSLPTPTCGRRWSDSDASAFTPVTTDPSSMFGLPRMSSDPTTLYACHATCDFTAATYESISCATVTYGVAGEASKTKADKDNGARVTDGTSRALDPSTSAKGSKQPSERRNTDNTTCSGATKHDRTT